MAKAFKIREGLFRIPWSVQNVSSTKSIQVEVTNLNEFFKSCKLTYSFEGRQTVLEMDITPSRITNSPDALKKMIVMASKDGLQEKMSFNEFKWRTLWYNENATPSVVCAYCGSGGYYSGKKIPKTYFEILIDCTPDGLLSVKKGAKHVLDHLKKLWENKIQSDVTFKCEKKLIKAHTLVLGSGSPVLAAMFQNDFKENRERMVEIKDIRPTIFEDLLRFMYTGEAMALENGDQDGCEIADLLIAADKYAVDSLKDECEICLSRIITAENATRYLVFSHVHNSSKLLESTMDFIAKNAKAICSGQDWMDIIRKYPELCFQATQRLIGL